MGSWVDKIPGHYWALVFVVILIVVDAVWWGNLRRAFNKTPASSSKQSKSSSRYGKKPTQQSGPFTGQKLILTRSSSMYFDEDGDLAHEFYVEQGDKLVRVTRGLRRQGPVELPIPAINPNLSVVMQYMKRDDDSDDAAGAKPGTAKATANANGHGRSGSVSSRTTGRSTATKSSSIPPAATFAKGADPSWLPQQHTAGGAAKGKPTAFKASSAGGKKAKKPKGKK